MKPAVKVAWIISGLIFLLLVFMIILAIVKTPHWIVNCEATNGVCANDCAVLEPGEGNQYLVADEFYCPAGEMCCKEMAKEQEE